MDSRIKLLEKKKKKFDRIWNSYSEESYFGICNNNNDQDDDDGMEINMINLCFIRYLINKQRHSHLPWNKQTLNKIKRNVFRVNVDKALFAEWM